MARTNRHYGRRFKGHCARSTDQDGGGVPARARVAAGASDADRAGAARSDRAALPSHGARATAAGAALHPRLAPRVELPRDVGRDAFVLFDDPVARVLL